MIRILNSTIFREISSLIIDDASKEDYLISHWLFSLHRFGELLVVSSRRGRSQVKITT
jgi:hypothetical protein